MTSRIRWRWHVLALLPGVTSIVLFMALVLVSLNARHNAEWVAQTWMVVMWAVIGSPLMMPIYTYLVGRSYVRANYPGLKSPIPFAIMYSVANFALWLGGVILVGIMGKPFP
ncbi:MAG TPA: hypothetical protein VFG30_37980 [Polyangiales bacterium]|nr:hypothetical protein [Polyangiales bacterium]